MCKEEDMYIGNLVCDGHSQRAVTRMVNEERRAEGQKTLDRKTVRRAEQRVQLVRRKRPKTKAGSTDLEGAWAQASLAQSLQFKDQLERVELNRAAIVLDGPEIGFGRNKVTTSMKDPFNLVGTTIKFLGNWWPNARSADRKKKWPCKLLGHATKFRFGDSQIDRAYTMECEREVYPIREQDALDGKVKPE